MLDINYIRDHPDEVKQNIRNRGVDSKIADVNKLLAVDKERRDLILKVEELRHGRILVAEKRDIDRGRRIKEELKDFEERLRLVTEEWQAIMDRIPNMLAPETPLGESESDNLEIKAWTPQSGYLSLDKLGRKDFSKRWMPSFDFSLKDHLELGKSLDIIDVEQSAKTSGSRFAYLKNGLVLLQYALFELLFKKLIKDYDFHPMVVPLLVKERVLYGTSHFPEGRDQVYKIENSNIEENQDLFLVGSSEPSLFAYWMDKTVNEKDLPFKMCAYSSCFRSEVGSWGRDVRGIKRVHQFDKLEMDVICKPDQSNKVFEEMLEINEWFLQQLKLPYHLILKCSADSGYSASAKQVDIEIWLPSQKEFIEVGTNTNATDFQARRLNIKYQDKGGEKHLAHTVNDTGCPMGRILIAILENYQNPGGNVTVPEVLREYVGKEVI